MIFTAAVDMVIFGKDLFLAVSFNLRDPIGSLRTTSDKSTEWYKDKMNQPGATDTDTNYYDTANPYVDFEMTGESHALPLSPDRSLKHGNEPNGGRVKEAVSREVFLGCALTDQQNNFKK